MIVVSFRFLERLKCCFYQGVGYPSGQRGQTVNLLALPSQVRILFLPPPFSKKTRVLHPLAPICRGFLSIFTAGFFVEDQNNLSDYRQTSRIQSQDLQTLTPYRPIRISGYAEGKRIFRRCDSVTAAKLMALAVWREMARWQAGAAAPSPKVVSELKLAQNALRALGAPILDAVRRRASRRTGHLVLCPPSPNSTSWKDFGESHHLETLLTSVNSSCSISKSRCQPPDWWLKTPKRSNMAPSLKSSLSNSRDTDDSSNVAVTSRFFG